MKTLFKVLVELIRYLLFMQSFGVVLMIKYEFLTIFMENRKNIEKKRFFQKTMMPNLKKSFFCTLIDNLELLSEFLGLSLVLTNFYIIYHQNL